MVKKNEPAPTATLLDETDKAIAAAKADGTITDRDAGTVAAIRVLARRIDLHAEYMDALAKHREEVGGKPPHQDTVTVPTYLKYSHALGLTPEARLAKQPKPGKDDKPAEPKEEEEPKGPKGLRQIGFRAS